MPGCKGCNRKPDQGHANSDDLEPVFFTLQPHVESRLVDLHSHKLQSESGFRVIFGQAAAPFTYLTNLTSLPIFIHKILAGLAPRILGSGANVVVAADPAWGHRARAGGNLGLCLAPSARCGCSQVASVRRPARAVAGCGEGAWSVSG